MKQIKHQRAVNKFARTVLAAFVTLNTIPFTAFYVGGVFFGIKVLGPIAAFGYQLNAFTNGAIVLWKHEDVWEMFMKTFRKRYYKTHPHMISSVQVAILEH